MLMRRRRTTSVFNMKNDGAFLLRRLVCENAIKKHRAMMEDHTRTMADLVFQLSIHRGERDAHKQLL